MTMSNWVDAPSLSVAVMVTVLRPASAAMNVPVTEAVSPLEAFRPSMELAPVRDWGDVNFNRLPWLWPEESNPMMWFGPNTSVIVSQPRFSVATGFRLFVLRAVLMLKNLKSNQLMPSSVRRAQFHKVRCRSRLAG